MTDFWRYNWEKSCELPQTMESDKQLIVETEDEIYLATSGCAVLFVTGLYDGDTSLEPKRLRMSEVKRWCYFKDFVKASLSTNKEAN